MSLAQTTFTGTVTRDTDQKVFYAHSTSFSNFFMNAADGSETWQGVCGLGLIYANNNVLGKFIYLFNQNVPDINQRVVWIQNFDIRTSDFGPYFSCERMMTANNQNYIYTTRPSNVEVLPSGPASTIKPFYQEQSGAKWKVELSNPSQGWFRVISQTDGRVATCVISYDEARNGQPAAHYYYFQFYNSDRVGKTTRLRGKSTDSGLNIYLDNGDVFIGLDA